MVKNSENALEELEHECVLVRTAKGKSMKILIMGFTKIKYTPYLNLYLENIDTTSNEVHLLYWNRDLQVENTSFLKGVVLHEFRCKQDDDVAKIFKIGSFIKFKRYAQKVIKDEKFDLIIVLQSLPGVLLYNTLCKKYEDRYIFDYRDSTYERFALFKKVVGKLPNHYSSDFSEVALIKMAEGDYLIHTVQEFRP